MRPALGRCVIANIFELVGLADVCVCGVLFEQVLDLAALGEGWTHVFPIHRAVSDT